MHFNEALLESMIYALAYVECVAKRYSWPAHLHHRRRLLSEGTEAVDRERESAESTKLWQRSGRERRSPRLLN